MPELLPCLFDTNLTASGDLCQEAKICVLDGTTHQAEIASFLPVGSIVSTSTRQEFYSSFMNGSCNILAGEQFDLAPAVLESMGYSGSYEVDTDVLTKELISVVTRDGDSIWSDFVNHMVQSLMTAEELRLSNSNFATTDFPSTDFFGSGYETMFQDAFAVVASYDSLYSDHMESLVPRTSANQINLGNSAAMYAIPFGSLSNSTPALTSSTIEAIIGNGTIKVGVTNAPLFSFLDGNGGREGIDVDFAKAVAAALFGGVVAGKIEYVLVSAENRFQALQEGKVDIIARVTTNTMERDVEERTTKKGVTFSTTMFHDSVRMVGSLT